MDTNLTQFWECKDFGLGAEDIIKRLVAVATGFVVAYLMAFCGFFITVWIYPPGTHPAEETFPAPRLLQRCLVWAAAHSREEPLFPKVAAFLKIRCPKGLWFGYLFPPTGALWAAHCLALTFAVATFLLTYLLKVYRDTYIGESHPAPALCYVLILLLDINWILSFAAFFLDRYRVPLIVPLAILCIIGAHAPSSDHYYSSVEGAAVQTISPYDVLSARCNKPIIVVATAGGGIQAAAWTMEVLSGLDELSRGAWKKERDARVGVKQK